MRAKAEKSNTMHAGVRILILLEILALQNASQSDFAVLLTVTMSPPRSEDPPSGSCASEMVRRVSSRRSQMGSAHRGRSDLFLAWACDRLARSTRHFLTVLDDLNRLQIEFVSLRENIDTATPLGRAIIVIVGTVAGLERSSIVERGSASTPLPSRSMPHD